MTETSEIRIRELKRRIAQDPTSPLFIGLAEEYRTTGRLTDAIRTLEHGVHTHPNYISAKVALARAYLEAGHTGDAAALFERVLGMDPGNLVSARALADIALSRGDRQEALKRLKLYRALSADRGVDETIARIETEIESPAPGEPRGRVLARLYLEQGHPAEAIAVLDELSRTEPGDPEIETLRREAAAHLSPRGAGAATVAADPAARRRASAVAALKGWLAAIRRAAGAGSPGP
ncbi:MAG TPA: tetratricopeptide repeat protein [Thermoanaerobaculia bacterium]|nr:tetratricopeptide repeat protein [Thermoanaerobaculia bacterium]